MTRPEIITALAKAIYCHGGGLPAPWSDDLLDHPAWTPLRKEAESQAAAVLKLVKPKPLVWVYPSDGSAHDADCRYEIVQDGKYWRMVKGVTGGGSYIGHFPDRAAAQAAAQEHADAAWVASTPLGDMMEGE